MSTASVNIAPDYYLTNFKFLVSWVLERYEDLLNESEKKFAEIFQHLDHSSQCLFVRLSSRKGILFRADKLKYTEIESLDTAAKTLIKSGLISNHFLLPMSEVAGLLTKAEILDLYKEDLHVYKNERKEILTQILEQKYPSEHDWHAWTCHKLGDLYRLETDTVISNFLLLFFGNPHQDLTEFVLQDLGLFRYENYVIHQQNRIFKSRSEFEEYRQLLTLREQLATATSLDELILVAEMLSFSSTSSAMSARYSRFYNQIAYEFERFGEADVALSLYQQSHLPPARERRVRLLEKRGDHLEAWTLLNELLSNPCDEYEKQIGQRMAPRIAKKAGHVIAKSPRLTVVSKEIFLPRLCNEEGHYLSVEEIARLHFHSDSNPCFYVENQLLNGLFGLWLWPEIFRNVDSAFANPFQSAPLDMYEIGFVNSRPQIEDLWNLFEANTYAEHIRKHWKEKNGIANHFVNWRYLNENLLDYALRCIPAQHLKLIFERLLFDLKSNRSGLPDLIQFFPQNQTYCMLEIKGPGDRIQDNQQRWLDYFAKHGIPTEVIYVNWQ